MKDNKKLELLKQKLIESKNKIKKMFLSQSYKDYMIKYEERINTKPFLIMSFCFITITILNGFLGYFVIEKITEISNLIKNLYIVSILMNTWGGYRLILKMDYIEENMRGMLNENDFIIKELKDKTLNINQIKLFDEIMLLLKSNLEETEFNELLFKTEKISGKRIGNAYFYYVLFSNYDEIISEVKLEKEQKKIIEKKLNALIKEEVLL